MYNSIKQNYIEVERGVEYMNYQKRVAILTDFWRKRRLKDPKMRKLLEKSQKLTKKTTKFLPILNLKNFQALQNTVASIS